jgi:hypothetical protein
LELAPVRTNDEVGELAVALNHMTSRLGEARDALHRANVELEDRVAAATRTVRSLYDTTRAITSTIDPEDVLRLIEERIVAALRLSDLVLVRQSPLGDSLEAYATRHGRLDLGGWRDLSAIAGQQPAVRPLAVVAPLLPPPVRAALAGPNVLTLPLLLKGLQQGVILGSVGAHGPDLEPPRRSQARPPSRSRTSGCSRRCGDTSSSCASSRASAREERCVRCRASCTTASGRPRRDQVDTVDRATATRGHDEVARVRECRRR